MIKKKLLLFLLFILLVLALLVSGSLLITGEKTSEDKVVVIVPQDPDYLDPHLASAAGTYEMMFNIYEGLVKPASDGTIRPAVAEKYTISKDGLTYTFYLRKGIKFHNGREVTTDDVKYSLDRLMGTNTGTPLSPFFQKVDTVQVPDDQRIIIKLKEVDASLLSNLIAAIIPKDNPNPNINPIGTGPFRFVEYRPGQHVVMEKFGDYWDQGLPLLDKVEFKILPDQESALIALKTGTVDIYPRIDNARVKELGEEFYYIQGMQNLVQVMAMNIKRKPFNDLRVRKAINYAIDIEEIIEMAAFGFGTKLGSGISPAMVKYYEPGLEDKYRYNPEKAKELLAVSGFKNGFKTTISVPSNYQFHVDTAQIIVEQLKRVGIEAKIELVEWAVWLQRIYKGRDYEMTVTGLSGKLDPMPILIRYTFDYPNNFFNFSNSEFDALNSQAAAENNPDKRSELYKKAQRILAEEAAAVFIMDPNYTVALKKSLSGYKIYPLYIQDMSTVHYTK